MSRKCFACGQPITSGAYCSAHQPPDPRTVQRSEDKGRFKRNDGPKERKQEDAAEKADD